MKTAQLLPLTKYAHNGQYDEYSPSCSISPSVVFALFWQQIGAYSEGSAFTVLPFAAFIAEPCNYALLTTNRCREWGLVELEFRRALTLLWRLFTATPQQYRSRCIAPTKCEFEKLWASSHFQPSPFALRGYRYCVRLNRSVVFALFWQQIGAYSEGRSEERRVGKECRSRWSPYH